MAISTFDYTFESSYRPIIVFVTYFLYSIARLADCRNNRICSFLK